MSKIKDKFIGVYEIKAERDLNGNEVKVKRYTHGRNRLYAYVRELSENEKFAAKSTGAELFIIFKVNYNERVKVGQFIEFREETYSIVSVDAFEFYRRELSLRAMRVKPEVYDYEEFDE